jgi:hypothetical protein
LFKLLYRCFQLAFYLLEKIINLNRKSHRVSPSDIETSCMCSLTTSVIKAEKPLSFYLRQIFLPVLFIYLLFLRNFILWI